MADRNPKLDPYFEKARTWGPEMKRLRGLMLEFPVEERMKWRQPCYVYEGSNVGIVTSLKAKAMISFFRGALLDDPEGRLEAPGANSQAARYLPFTSTDQIDAAADSIRGYIRNALQLIDRGEKVDFSEKYDLKYPEELTEALEEDSELAEAWDALTPGRKRGWVLLFAEAKQSSTRRSRVDRARTKILAGKGRHDR